MTCPSVPTVVGPERRPSRQHLVHIARCVDVRRGSDQAQAEDLLRGQERRAQRKAGAGLPARRRARANPKSAILGVPSSVNRTLPGLQVAVNDPAGVGRLNDSSQRFDHAAARPAVRGATAIRSARLPPSMNSIVKYWLLVVVADVVDLHNVAVAKARGRLRLALGSAPVRPVGQSRRPAAP